jgi:hypothetical protein
VSKNTVDGDTGNLAAPASVKSVAPPPAVSFTVNPVHVAEGVWWLHSTGNHSSALYEFKDHLTMFEVPSSAAQARALFDAARSLLKNGSPEAAAPLLVTLFQSEKGCRVGPQRLLFRRSEAVASALAALTHTAPATSVYGVG